MARLKTVTCTLCVGTTFSARSSNLTVSHQGVKKVALVCRGCADLLDPHPFMEVSKSDWEKRHPSVSFDLLPIKVD